MECKIPALIWLIEVTETQGPLDRHRGAGELPGAGGKGGGCTAGGDRADKT
ncbi:MAG: hypothetical protein MUO42_01360 [Anaerolineaceae bacterium]|nr:hypothetical protein [Anaerolineaceae bacterium]